jgi:hypothetical protein
MIPDMRISELFGEGDIVTQRGGLARQGLVGYSDDAEDAAALRNPDVAFGQALQEQKADADIERHMELQTGGARRSRKVQTRRKVQRRKVQKRRKTQRLRKTVKRTNWLRLTASVRLRQQK